MLEQLLTELKQEAGKEKRRSIPSRRIAMDTVREVGSHTGGQSGRNAGHREMLVTRRQVMARPCWAS